MFICKSCGAQSPDGIGYWADDEHDAPAPSEGCPNPHLDDDDDDEGCDGHESLSGAHMGETVYCDGSCR